MRKGKLRGFFDSIVSSFGFLSQLSKKENWWKARKDYYVTRERNASPCHFVSFRCGISGIVRNNGFCSVHFAATHRGYETAASRLLLAASACFRGQGARSNTITIHDATAAAAFVSR